MANNDNSMEDLKVRDDVYIEADQIFITQDYLQEMINGHFASTVHERFTVQELCKILVLQKHAMDDEFSELLDAMGGIKDGIGSAGWKWWKQANKTPIYLKDLSEHDLKELKFEYVDMFHFFINMGLLLGITGSELFNMYYSKNKENIDRQKRGY